MSTTVSKHQNLIGGEWVDSSGGETMEVLNPATGEVIAEVPRATAEDVDRAVQAAKKALAEWLETTPGERRSTCSSSPTRSRSTRRSSPQLESQNVGKPLSYARDEMPVCADNIRFFAGAARVLEGKSAGEYMRGLHLVAPPRADRRRRRHRALELPADDGGLEDRARRWRRATCRCSSRPSRRR